MFGDVQPPKVASHVFLVSPQKCLNEVAQRYQFSEYIYDPNKYSFSKSVLVVSLLFRFINNCRNKVRTNSSKPRHILLLWKHFKQKSWVWRYGLTSNRFGLEILEGFSRLFSVECKKRVWLRKFLDTVKLRKFLDTVKLTVVLDFSVGNGKTAKLGQEIPFFILSF